jgi:O-antigen/teichoic acid export membrane protein
MHAVLVIFGTGAAVAAACGPIELVLQLTGLQHSLLKLLVVVNIFGLAITALTAHLFGPIGAASSIAATVITWNVMAVLISARSIHINPSITGLFFGARSDKPQPVQRSVT